jgi:hypothetical protein
VKGTEVPICIVCSVKQKENNELSLLQQSQSSKSCEENQNIC